jgi:hypothetical protein
LRRASTRSQLALLLLLFAVSGCSGMTLRAGGAAIPVVGLKARSPGLAALQIRIRDEYRAPVPQVTVRVLPVGTTAEDRQISSTDDSGQVTFTDLPPGKYEILVQPPPPYDQSMVRSTVNLEANQARELSFQVKRCTAGCK